MDLKSLRLIVVVFCVQAYILKGMEQDKEQPYYQQQAKLLGIHLPLQPDGESKKEAITKAMAHNKEDERFGVTDCALCFKEDVINVQLRCKHKFCLECIIAWENAPQQKVCPQCSKDLVIEEWTCRICKGHYKTREDMESISCGHIFCSHCTNEVILKNPQSPKCPICKEAIKLTHTPVASPRAQRNNNAQEAAKIAPNKSKESVIPPLPSASLPRPPVQENSKHNEQESLGFWEFIGAMFSTPKNTKLIRRTF